MAYVAWSVVFGEQPSAAKWNILGQNDASFNDGTGLGNQIITPNKLATGAAAATQANSGTTTSTSYTATLGGTPGTNPAVTVNIGVNGIAFVAIKTVGSASGTPAGQGWFMGFAISGASTVAAADLYSVGIVNIDVAANAQVLGTSFLITGLNAGSTTFTLQYRASGTTTCTYSNRVISVLPL